MARKLEHETRKLLGKNWGRSSLTNLKRMSNLRSITRFLESTGIQRIQDLKTKHVISYVEYMQRQGRKASTIENHLTVFREIAEKIGKKNIIPIKNRDLGVTRADRYQPKTPDMAAHALVRERLYAKDERLGIAHDLREAFGLRVKESLLSRDVIEKNGVLYLQVAGAKGGRPREIIIDSIEKVRACERLADMITAQGTPGLIPADKTLKQFYKYQSNALYRSGATKEDSANAHTLRHGYAQARIAEGKSDAEVQSELGHGELRRLWHYVSR